MNTKDLVFLQHILEQIDKIENSTKNMTKENFNMDINTQDATIRRIEIIGEAVKNISEELKKKNPQIAWRKIAGTRDIVIHSYFNVDWNLVWKVVKEDIKELRDKINSIIKVN